MKRTILTRDELSDMSGYKRPSKIKTWLQENGIRYLEDARGWPVVMTSTMEAFFNPDAANDETCDDSAPNFGALAKYC